MPKGFLRDEEYSRREGRSVWFVVEEKRGEKRRRRRTPRRVTRLKGKIVTYAKFVWLKHHPGDKIETNQNIHHKDFDCTNDNIDNLIKIDESQHKLLHERKHSNIDNRFLIS